jgi:hypothetical protein
LSISQEEELGGPHRAVYTSNSPPSSLSQEERGIRSDIFEKWRVNYAGRIFN